MNTRAINTSGTDTSCDVCGRTLLRGERAEFYVNGGARRAVCDLCTSRAVQEGWIREGTVPAFDAGDARSERRRSLLSRLRGRQRARRGHRDLHSMPATMPATRARNAGRSLLSRLRGRSAPAGPLAPPSPTLGEELDSQSWAELAPAPARARDQQLREPRQVHAVPASDDHKIASAVDLFNGCEHRRTVAGVARSLGLPTVAVLPSGPHPSIVNVVVSWELCWYRYEVDLSEDQPHVRVSAQGYELDELSELERTANATADDSGGVAV